MAHVNPQKKRVVLEELRKAIPRSWRWSLSAQNHSTLVLTVYSAPVDLLTSFVARVSSDEHREWCLRHGHAAFNRHDFGERFRDATVRGVFARIFDAMDVGNRRRGSAQDDYVDIGHYTAVRLGRPDKPFRVGVGRLANSRPS